MPLKADTVVVPFDFSEASVPAVETALEISEDPSKVHVIHVLAPLTASEPGVVWGTINDEARKKHALDAMRERLTDVMFSQLQLQVEIGDPGHVVADYAERVDADLIVTPSHGRRGWSRLLIGSVAERILRLAPCPVLVLRQ